MSDITTIRIGEWFQGPTGSGQGGWTSQRFLAAVSSVCSTPVTAAIRAAIPLEIDLAVRAIDDGWALCAPDDTVVMTASVWAGTYADTEQVSVAAATAARHLFAEVVGEHPVPSCFSCGQLPGSMGVQGGPLDDGTDRFATDWTVPDWAVGDDGHVDSGALWAALDCCAAWWVGWSREPRNALTVQYAVEELAPLEPGATYALVGWAGDNVAEWDGRKRHGASAAFDANGNCVARSTSFWVSV